MQDEQTTPQTIRLDFVAADENNPDPATVGEFGRAVVKQLSSDGYDIQPLYTEEKGGEHFILTIVQAAWDHKEIIASTVGGLVGGTATNLGNIKTIIDAIEKIQEKLKPVHQDIGNVTVTLKADGDEIVQGTPEAVSKYSIDRKKNLELTISVPRKPKRRHK